MNRYLYSIFVIFLAGCGTALPRYEKPKTEITAQLRYAVGMQQGSLYMFDDKQCSKNGTKAAHLRADFGAALHGVNQKLIGMPDAESTSKRILGELLIDAEKPKYFAVFGADEGYPNTSTCSGFFGFNPKRGGDYEITLDRRSSACRIQITEITRSNEAVYTRLPVDTISTSKSDCPAAYDVDGGFR